MVIGRKTTGYPVDGFFGREVIDTGFVELVETAIRDGPQVRSGRVIRRCEEGVCRRDKGHDQRYGDDEQFLSP